MDRAEFKTKLQTFIQDDLLGGMHEVGFEDELLIDGLVDSVGMMRMMAHLDAEWDIQVPADELVIENFGNINAMAEYLERKLGEDS